MNPDLLVVSGVGPSIDQFIASVGKGQSRHVPIVSNGAKGAALWLNIDIDEVLRLGADVIARILRGVSPAELPVALPTRYRMEIDPRAAQEQGLRIPESILVRADRIVR